jgi:hypothetical protein
VTAAGRAPESDWLRAVALCVVAFVFALIVVFVSVLAGGARFGPATLGLGLAAATLVFALWGMSGMVRALLRPTVSLALELEQDLGTPVARLREEKLRVLRALKELEFDHAMGKLSEADYKTIADHYKLRAVAVIRRLEGGERHPEIERLLAQDADPEPAGEEPSARPSGPDLPKVADATNCPSCARTNDDDARFCKHCGAALLAAEVKA